VGFRKWFLYATRIGAGLRIEGAGESTSERDDELGASLLGAEILVG